MIELTVAISAGELIDKITILRLKAQRITDAARLTNVLPELAALEMVANAKLPKLDELAALTDTLQDINTQLWNIEDDIRACEAKDDFGERFIKLARSVYIVNDRRSEVKRRINLLLGSRIVEEKSYSNYGNGK